MKFSYLRYSLGLVLFIALISAGSASAATVPTGFTDSLVANGLTDPTAMALASDGRIFVCEQRGTLRVIKNGALLPTPFLTVTVDSSGERGLLGVTFDPILRPINWSMSTTPFLLLRTIESVASPPPATSPSPAVKRS